MNFNEFPKNWLADKNWEEISRTVGESHIALRLRHINPEINIAPELAKGYGQGKSISEYESIVYHGISTKKGLGMKDFFTMMTDLAESGLAPDITLASVQNLKNQYEKADVDISGKYDLDVIITITEFSDEKLAEAQLASYQVVPTRGFTEMPIPGLENAGIKNLDELLESDYYKSTMKSLLPKEQFEQLEKGLPKLKEEFKKVSKQVKEQYQELKAKTGAQYYQGKYQGFPAIFVRTENSEFKRYSAPKPVIKSSSKTMEAGGGGFDPNVTLPPRPKVIPSKYLEMCLASMVSNFIISGNLLYMMSSFPPGNTFCHSLTKSQKKVEIERIEGKIYRTTHILPVNSTLADEGYLNREEVEKIFNTLFSLLEK